MINVRKTGWVLHSPTIFHLQTYTCLNYPFKSSKFIWREEFGPHPELLLACWTIWDAWGLNCWVMIIKVIDQCFLIINYLYTCMICGPRVEDHQFNQPIYSWSEKWIVLYLHNKHENCFSYYSDFDSKNNFFCIKTNFISAQGQIRKD